MGSTKSKEDVIKESPQQTEEGKMELYLYSLRKQAQMNLDKSKSSLTSLHNTNAFFYLGNELIRENQDKRFGVIVMDIDQFKAVNEFCGRSEGDRMLVFIGECFRSYQENRPDTVACHIRADNFCMCTAFQDENELIRIVEDIYTKIEEFPFTYRVIPSFGICAAHESNPSVSYLKDCATTAMKKIKGKVFATYAVFDEQMRRQLMHEKMVESDIVDALAKEELVLFIQPKVEMCSGRIVGGEALVRWMHPEKGMVGPAEFISVLEKNGFIINLDEYIWRHVFRYLAGLKKENRPLIPISVNVSRIHAYDRKLCETLLELREDYQIPAEYVPLELTESAFLEDEEGMYNRMKLLQTQGFSVSMDDFGTGYSSMNMLKNQPVDEIKVDRGFIVDMENEKSRIIIKHTINMLNALHTRIIAEGVETEEQKQFLLECGCKYAQGFLFYKPMPVEEFDALVAKQQLS